MAAARTPVKSGCPAGQPRPRPRPSCRQPAPRVSRARVGQV